MTVPSVLSYRICALIFSKSDIVVYRREMCLFSAGAAPGIIGAGAPAETEVEPRFARRGLLLLFGLHCGIVNVPEKEAL